MRSFQQVVLFLVALVAFAFAQEPQSYDATVYVTSTIFKVNTVTLSSSPAYEVANSTSTVVTSSETAPAYSSAVYSSYSVPANSTAPYPTGTSAPAPVVPSPSAPAATEFPGAASSMSVNGALVAFVAALAFFAL